MILANAKLAKFIVFIGQATIITIIDYTLWLQITHYDCKLHTMIVNYTLWL